MSTIVAIMGESGTGKSTSIRNLDPKTTCIINIDGKDLPFKGWKKKYSKYSKKDNPTGNLFVSDNVTNIIKILQHVDEMKEIKTIVIDDSQYIMANEFMRRAGEKGYEKFSEIGRNMFDVIETARRLRDDLTVFFLTHTETTDMGFTKIKTIGKMLDDKVTVEGKFTIVLMSVFQDGNYNFSTKTSGFDRVKAPMGMFKEQLIENDLQLVVDAIEKYNNED
jgi:hypothetical protein